MCEFFENLALGFLFLTGGAAFLLIALAFLEVLIFELQDGQ